MHILWIILIGFVAGAIARYFAAGPDVILTGLSSPSSSVSPVCSSLPIWANPSDGIAWTRAPGLIGATLGAVLVLFVWNRLVVTNTVRDPGVGPRRWL